MKTSHLPVPGMRDRAEALLRSLVGVEDACVVPAAAGAPFEVRVLPGAGAHTTHVTRNVTSAIFAGFGVRLLPCHVQVVTGGQLAEIRAARAPLLAADTPSAERAPGGATGVVPAPEAVAAPAVPFGPYAAPAGAPTAATGNGGDGASGHAVNGQYVSGNGATAVANGRALNSHPANGNGAAVAAPRYDPDADTVAAPLRPAPRPHAVALDNEPQVRTLHVTTGNGQARCHVTIAAFGQAQSGAGEAPVDSADATVTLVARVTAEALRELTGPGAAVSFAGAARVVVAGRPHVVVSFQNSFDGRAQPLAGAAAVTDSDEHAAAAATIGALRPLF